MSKAFTKEDNVQEEPLFTPRPRTADGLKRPITPQGQHALRQELDALPPEQTRRIQQLQAILDDVRVIDARPDDPHEIAFGAWVTLEDEENTETTYRLVGPDEADARSGRLSIESPLARALLGRTEGDIVQFERPRGTAEFTITAVTYDPPLH